MKRFGVLILATVLAGCGHMQKAGKVNQYANPAVDGSKIKRISLIGDGRDRANSQIISRARTRLTKAGVTLIVRSGSWESNEAALKDICVQRPHETDNVDGVAFVGWDHLTLHDCASGQVATDITGSYAGTDALVDRLLMYLRVERPS